MTLQECYQCLHGDYTEVISRLQMERLVEKFLLKFPTDGTMQSLRDAIATGNIQESFRAAHTLKGLAANLAFTELLDNAHALTEQLRPCTEPADEELFKRVEASYELIRETIAHYEAKQ